MLWIYLIFTGKIKNWEYYSCKKFDIFRVWSIVSFLILTAYIYSILEKWYLTYSLRGSAIVSLHFLELNAHSSRWKKKIWLALGYHLVCITGISACRNSQFPLLCCFIHTTPFHFGRHFCQINVELWAPVILSIFPPMLLAFLL